MTRSYDGIVCFGGADWWYHNRGHYDIQMCRQFAKQIPVVYINSIGVRTPKLKEGSMFFRRVLRKLASYQRGFVKIDNNFAVLSPLSFPGKLARKLLKPIVNLQIKRSIKRMGISRPLIWVECPTAIDLALEVDAAGLIYQRTDRYEEFPGADPELIKDCDERLKQAADVTLYCSNLLYDEEKSQSKRACFIDHGVDFDSFLQAGTKTQSDPFDMKSIQRPRIGFVGGIDEHTFDAKLFNEVASKLPDMNFVLVGQCSLPPQWCELENVHLLGRKPYEDVPEYMAACDVLIMPWNDNDWVKACNPVKLKEYLAVGRPVVSSPFDELSKYSDCVNVARNADEFAQAIAKAINEPGNSTERQNRVRSHTWQAKARECQQEFQQQGLVMQGISEVATAITA